MRAVALTAFVATACGGAGVDRGDRIDRVSNVLRDPRDASAHLSLASYDDAHGMPGEALEQLQIVENLGGPLGVRWQAEDRARMARLLVARSAARVARGAASGLADLEHAQRLGAAVPASDLAAARRAVAIAQLHHVDADERAKGRALLATLPDPDGTSRGARANATADEHGRFGAWLWQLGARREAYEQLSQWHRTSSEPGPISDAFTAATAWWTGNGTLAVREPEPVPPQAIDNDDPRIVAAARYAHTRFAGAPSFEELLAVALAFRGRDHGGDRADRLGRELVARQVDEAAGHAALGALFDALGDPARAHTHWQAAVEGKDIGSAEPVFVRGLAEAAARTDDSSAAIVFATQAAAAWGDPAAVWIAVGTALEETGDHVSALVCARSAVDLAGPDLMPRARDLAIEASAALGREHQVESLRVQRYVDHPRGPDPLDPADAVAGFRTLPTAGTVAGMWVASRAHPADLDVRIALLGALPADDPRRATLISELAAFAGDPDEARALAAVRALP